MSLSVKLAGKGKCPKCGEVAVVNRTDHIFSHGHVTYVYEPWGGKWPGCGTRFETATVWDVERLELDGSL